MNTWEDRFRLREQRVPRVDLLEICWRFIGPSGRVLESGIYAVATGIEVRVGYSTDDVVRTQLTPEIGSAREVAAVWRQALIGKCGFEEVPVPNNERVSR